MARGFIRKPSFCKILGALRAQGKRSIMRALFPGIYGKRGMGILNDPKKAAYNWLYNRTSISIYDLFGGKRGGISGFVYSIVYICASIVRIIALPYDIAQCCAKGIKTQRRLKKSITTQKGKGKSNVKKTHRQRLDTPSHKTEDKKEQSFSVDTQTIESVYSMDKNWEKPIYIKEETENTENVPKSVPINPDDQYIKKRMRIVLYVELL